MTDPTKGIELAHAAAMPAPQGGALPTGLEWQALERMAHTLADSDVIPYRLKRKPADVAVILLAAREYGIPPLMALSKLPVINGTPAPMGELMVALVLRAGHTIRVVVEGEGGPWDDTVAVCTTRRRDEDTDDVLRFTFTEAKAAGLVSLVDGKPYARDQKGAPTPWELYPVNMLRWRAVANACRLRFPDVLLGMSYLPEELGAIVDADGAPVLGEVVEEPRRAPAGGTLEQRTAQDAATRLETEGAPPHVLDALTEHATANGYLDQSVTFEGNPMTLSGAIALVRAKNNDTVDADVVEEPPAEQQAEQPPAEAPTPTEAPEAAQEAASAPSGDDSTTEDPRDAAYDLAREVLTIADPEVLRAIYRDNPDLRALDVMPVLDDDALAAIAAPQDLAELALGRLIIRAGEYVTRHGAAIRDLGEPLPPLTEPRDENSDAPADPWAADAAAGWPATPAP